jgi:hypothetical protein
MTFVIHDDVEQGSEAWHQLRCGTPTASMFGSILAKGEGKMRKAYLLRLAGEILTGEPAETYTNIHMERGKIMEDEARDAYVFQRDAELRRVAFVRNGIVGCSPDSLIAEDGGLEIKTALPHIQIERLLKGDLPSEYRAQVQGNMWVCGREFWDFVSYTPKLPLLIVRVRRDNGYIGELSGAVRQFHEELMSTVDLIRRYGEKAAA